MLSRIFYYGINIVSGKCLMGVCLVYNLVSLENEEGVTTFWKPKSLDL